MKVLGIVCSPRVGGNTEILVNEALAGAKELAAGVELIRLAERNISFCDGCDSCKKTKRCKIEDDMQEIYLKLLEADGIIFGTPVYFWNVSAQAKALIDRTYVFREDLSLRNKVVGVVVVGRRTGATQAFNAFNSFFTIHRMISAAGAMAYANREEIGPRGRGGGAIAYAGEKGEVRKDEQGMAEARLLGTVIAKSIRK
jgi:multimeric flavodoxin WrbA